MTVCMTGDSAGSWGGIVGQGRFLGGCTGTEDPLIGPRVFAQGVQSGRHRASVTFSGKIGGDLIITAAMTLHTETLRSPSSSLILSQRREKNNRGGREEELRNVSRCVSCQHKSLCYGVRNPTTKGQIIYRGRDNGRDAVKGEKQTAVVSY